MRAEVTFLHPLVHIQRKRDLPAHGEIKVRTGQKVQALDVIAEAEIPSGHFIVDVFSALHTKTPEDAEQLIIRKPGELLEKDDIIAETHGFLPRILRTPGPGRVISIVDGRVLIEAESQRFQFLAGYPGKVMEILPERSVSIDTDGMLLQGVWGNGKTGAGELVFCDTDSRGELDLSAVSAENVGKVVAADYCSSSDTLNQAGAAGIAGLVLGSMASSLVSTAELQPFPIILLGGFGRFNLDEFTRDLLRDNLGQEIFLNSAKWNRLTGERPEVIVPRSEAGGTYDTRQEIKVGNIVRVHAGEHTGKTGTLVRILPGFAAMPSGLKYNAAEVDLSDGNQILVPLYNLGILEVGVIHTTSDTMEDDHGFN